MKKLLAASFAALFATVTVSASLLPEVAKAADTKKDDKKKKDQDKDMKK